MLKAPPEWGIEPVPKSARLLKGFDLFVLWYSLGMGLLVLQAGAFLTEGLSLLGSFLVSLTGSLIGSLFLALAGTIGSKYGVPTMVSLRATLGRRGSFLPSIPMAKAAELLTAQVTSRFLWSMLRG